MLEIMNESTSTLVAVKATGTLTDNDYTEIWIPALQAVIDGHGKADALLYMDENFTGWDLKAMWEDARFGIKHRSDFNKIAIVGGPAWVKWGMKIGELLMDCEIKTFETDQLPQAFDWVG